MKKTLLVLALLATTPAAADTITLDSDTVACRYLDDYKRYRSIVEANDMVAYGKFTNVMNKSGDCKNLKAGRDVSAENRQGVYECLRPAGEYECFWGPGVVMLSFFKELEALKAKAKTK